MQAFVNLIVKNKVNVVVVVVGFACTHTHTWSGQCLSGCVCIGQCQLEHTYCTHTLFLFLLTQLFVVHPSKIYQIQQHPHTGVTAVAVAAPQGTYIQQQGTTPEQATLTASEAQQQQQTGEICCKRTEFVFFMRMLHTSYYPSSRSVL